MSPEMVKKIICIMGLIVLVAIPSKVYAPAPEPANIIGPSLSQYNHQRYLDYIGPEPEPFEVTYVEATEEPEKPEFTDEDIALMARVVMSEASLLPQDGKQAVAQTIINRYRSDKFPDTIYDVVYQPNQYSTHDNGEPNKACYDAVYAAIKYVGFPEDMYYFRRNYYHTWADDYCNIGNTYFSTEAKK